MKIKDTIPITLAIVAIILQFFAPPEKANTQSLIYFGIIVLVSIVALVVFAMNEKIKKIDSNEKKINRLAEFLNYKENIYKLDKRISLLESKMDKKGQIDPQTAIIIIMVILLILYLRSRGLIFS